MQAAAPKLSRQGLIWLLTGMCLVPLVTLIVLQLTMPPVRPGSLSASVTLLSVPPASYYEAVETRLPGHGEDLDRLQANGILIDGTPDDGGLLLQIFTATVIGPIFFEIIQRKGDEGFGEGNFRALFESIEQDQIKRGVLKA